MLKYGSQVTNGTDGARNGDWLLARGARKMTARSKIKNLTG